MDKIGGKLLASAQVGQAESLGEVSTQVGQATLLSLATTQVGQAGQAFLDFGFRISDFGFRISDFDFQSDFWLVPPPK